MIDPLLSTPAVPAAGDPELARLGWDGRLAAALEALGPGHEPGRIVHSDRHDVLLLTRTGRRAAVLTPRLLAPGAVEGGVCAGDWIALRGGSGVALLPRRSVLLRRAAGLPTAAQAVGANLDVVLVATPLGAGVNRRRIERTLALVWSSGAVPAVILTKADLSADLEADIDAAESVSAGAEVIALSAVDGRGVERAGELLPRGRTGGIIGPSGAGKSTLVNALCGAPVLATAEVRADGRGRHTTTRRELMELPGRGLLVDTPGMRELGLWDAAEGIDRVFGDIAALAAACRFRDCRHQAEPGCAVRAAAEADPAVAERLESRRKLEREQQRLERMQDARARAEAARELRRFMRSRRDQSVR